MTHRQLTQRRTRGTGRTFMMRFAALCGGVFFSIGLALAQDALPDMAGALNDPIPPDLALLLENLQSLPGETEAEFRARGEQLLAAQIVAERLLASSYPEALPLIEARVARLRGSLALDYILSRRITVQPPSEEDIDEFIADNPQLFAGRASFRYATYVIAPAGDEQQARAEELIQALAERTRVTASDLQGFIRALQEAEIQSVGRNSTATSEQIDPDRLVDLEALAEAGRVVQVSGTNDQTGLLVLLQRTPDPVDPAVMRQQVALGLIRTEVERQRARILETLAGSSRTIVVGDSENMAGRTVRGLVAGQGLDPDLDPQAAMDLLRSELEIDRAEIMEGRAGTSRTLVVGDRAIGAGRDVPQPAALVETVGLTLPIPAWAVLMGPYLGLASLALAGLATPMAFGLALRWAWRPTLRKRQSHDGTTAKPSVRMIKILPRVVSAGVFGLLCLACNGVIAVQGLQIDDQVSAASALAGGLALGLILAVMGERLIARQYGLILFWILQGSVLLSAAWSDMVGTATVLG